MEAPPDTIQSVLNFAKQVREEIVRCNALRAEVREKQRHLAELETSIEAMRAEVRIRAVRARAYIYVIRVRGGAEAVYFDMGTAEEAWADCIKRAGGEERLIDSGGMPPQQRILSPEDTYNIVVE